VREASTCASTRRVSGCRVAFVRDDWIAGGNKEGKGTLVRAAVLRSNRPLAGKPSAGGPVAAHQGAAILDIGRSPRTGRRPRQRSSHTDAALQKMGGKFMLNGRRPPLHRLVGPALSRNETNVWLGPPAGRPPRNGRCAQHPRSGSATAGNRKSIFTPAWDVPEPGVAGQESGFERTRDLREGPVKMVRRVLNGYRRKPSMSY